MILVVCTGNLHRSPMLEALIAAEGLGPVSSAGLHSPGGGAPPLMARAAADAGFDLSRHESRQLTPQMLADARLVLCMERDHVAEIALMHRPAFARTLTLREAQQLFVAHRPATDHTIEEWLAVAIGARKASDVLSAPRTWDTPDPIGGGLDDFRACVADIIDTAQPVLAGLRRLRADT